MSRTCTAPAVMRQVITEEEAEETWAWGFAPRVAFCRAHVMDASPAALATGVPAEPGTTCDQFEG